MEGAKGRKERKPFCTWSKVFAFCGGNASGIIFWRDSLFIDQSLQFRGGLYLIRTLFVICGGRTHPSITAIPKSKKKGTRRGKTKNQPQDVSDTLWLIKPTIYISINWKFLKTIYCKCFFCRIQHCNKTLTSSFLLVLLPRSPHGPKGPIRTVPSISSPRRRRWHIGLDQKQEQKGKKTIFVFPGKKTLTP